MEGMEGVEAPQGSAGQKLPKPKGQIPSIASILHDWPSKAKVQVSSALNDSPLANGLRHTPSHRFCAAVFLRTKPRSSKRWLKDACFSGRRIPADAHQFVYASYIACEPSSCSCGHVAPIVDERLEYIHRRAVAHSCFAYRSRNAQTLLLPKLRPVNGPAQDGRHLGHQLVTQVWVSHRFIKRRQKRH